MSLCLKYSNVDNLSESADELEKESDDNIDIQRTTDEFFASSNKLNYGQSELDSDLVDGLSDEDIENIVEPSVQLSDKLHTYIHTYKKGIQ